MRYFVTGASGFVGSHVVNNLVNDGHDVRALTRDRANAAHLPPEVSIVEGDITDKESLREAMQGVDGVFHLAGWYQLGPGPWSADLAEQINVDGTRNVLELVDELDIPKVVYTSTVAVNSDTRGNSVDESFRYDGPHLSVYDETKWRAHYEVAEPMAKEGLPIVIVQPGVVYGPGDTSGFASLWQDYLQGDLPAIPRSVAATFDHVEDTARAHILAMEHGEPGETYLITGDGYTFTEVFTLAEELSGVPAPRSISPVLFRLLAPVVGVVERFVKPPEGFESEILYRMAGTTWLADNTKAETDLGVEHRTLEEGLGECLDWHMEQLEVQAS